MTKLKPFRVQELTSQFSDGGSDSSVLHGLVAAAAIDFVTYYRVFYPGEMHSNLVCSSGLDLDVKQGEPVVTMTHAVQRKRRPAAINHRHAGAINRVACQWLIDATAVLQDDAM